MELIVGLGNPGQHYEATRHNVGCMVLRQLARRYQILWQFDHVRDGFVYGNWSLETIAVTLVTPIVGESKSREAVPLMMNQLGEAVRVALNRWPVEPEELLLVCDDVNLPLGALRLRAEGSDGGHHGLASCLEALKTQQVARLRIGIGVEPLPNDLTEFVLSPFRAEERPVIDQSIAKAVEGCEWWVKEGITSAMNRLNARTS